MDKGKDVNHKLYWQGKSEALAGKPQNPRKRAADYQRGYEDGERERQAREAQAKGRAERELEKRAEQLQREAEVQPFAEDLANALDGTGWLVESEDDGSPTYEDLYTFFVPHLLKLLDKAVEKAYAEGYYKAINNVGDNLPDVYEVECTIQDWLTDIGASADMWQVKDLAESVPSAESIPNCIPADAPSILDT